MWSGGWIAGPLSLAIWMSVVTGIAMGAGLIVGARLGPPGRSTLVGIAAYAAVAWLIYVPIGVIGSIWQGLQDGSIADAGTAATRVPVGLAYGFVSSIYMVLLLLPLGAAWVVSFRVLGRLVRP